MPGNCLLTPFLVQSQGRVLLNFSSSLCFRQRLSGNPQSQLGPFHEFRQGFYCGCLCMAVSGGHGLPCGFVRWDHPALHLPAQLCPHRAAPPLPSSPILTETRGQSVPDPPLLHLSSAEGEGLQVLGTAKQAGLLQALYLTLLKSSRLDRRALLRDFIGNLPPQRLLKQKLQSLTDIVNSKIFQSYGEKGHRGSWRHC